MERKRKTNKTERIEYDHTQEPIVLSKPLLDLLLTQPRYAELVALYTFYYYTAKWQKTNRVHATTSYTAKGVGWGTDKVKGIKSKLIELGLIEDVVAKDKDTGKITGYYISVKFIWSPDTLSRRLPATGVDLSQVKPASNALSVNTKNASSVGTHTRAREEYDEFMSQLPRAWDQNKNLKITLKNFIHHRHEKHKPLTHQAIKTLTNKLKKYPIDVVTAALGKAVESGWTGVFPESVKDSTPSQRQPDQILEDHPAVQPVYTAALKTLSVAHNGDAQRLAHRLVEMHRFITTHQSPEVRTNRQVPTPVMLMRDYAEWLGEQQWMDSVTPNTYDPGGRSFTRFLRDTCDSTGLNVFTGERV